MSDEMIQKLTRKSVELRIERWPANGSVGNDVANETWRRLCATAGSDVECDQASYAADTIVADARDSGKPWKEVAAKAISDLPVLD